MAVCFIGGAKVAVIVAEAFTLAWGQSGSSVEWQRIYDVAPGAIITRELRASHFGPGEQPLPGSVQEGDWYVWRGSRRTLPAVSFGSEPGAINWRICDKDKCSAVAELTGAPDGTDITAVPCKAEATK